MKKYGLSYFIVLSLLILIQLLPILALLVGFKIIFLVQLIFINIFSLYFYLFILKLSKYLLY